MDNRRRDASCPQDHLGDAPRFLPSMHRGRMTAQNSTTSTGSVLIAPMGHDRPPTLRRLRRAAARDRLVQLHQGVFIAPNEWFALKPWDRYSIAVLAYSLGRRTRAVFCGTTALHIWGVPLIPRPEAVMVRSRSDGAARTLPARQIVTGNHEQITLPAVQRRANYLGKGAGLDTAVERQVRLSDSRMVGTVLTDRLATSVVGVVSAPRVTTAYGLPVVDHLIRRLRPEPDAVLSLAHELLGPHTAAFRRFSALWKLAEPGAESAGESLSRALMHDLGFELPTLQHEIHDQHGYSLGRVDFWWESVGVAGEFDGRVKYSKPEFMNGRSPDAIIMAEKEREARIRMRVGGLLRWTWDDLRHPDRFAEMLSHHGVPQARRSTWAG